MKGAREICDSWRRVLIGGAPSEQVSPIWGARCDKREATGIERSGKFATFKRAQVWNGRRKVSKIYEMCAPFDQIEVVA